MSAGHDPPRAHRRKETHVQFIPYLNFDGDCAEAMAFYAEVFGGKITHQSTFGEMPAGEGMPKLPEAAKSRLMHAHLQVGEQAIMASDTLPAMPGQPAEACAGGYRKPQGMWVSISVDNATEGRRVFDALSKGGQVAMPFQPTFWSAGFGMVTDRFGTPWMVNVASAA
jgi:PhnB protein